MQKKNNQRVMVAGHICLDITPVFPDKASDDLAQILAPGKLVHVGQPDIHLGGSVANTGLAMNYFGAEVCLAAKIGTDSFAQIVRAQLGEHHCDIRLIEDEKEGTSYSVVIAVPGIDRVFLHSPGANDTFYAKDITDAQLADVSHFHFGYPPLMASMYQNGGAELEALFTRVKKMGITTSLDMAAVDPASPAGAADWHKILERVLPLVDFFVPSVEELGYMLNRAMYDDWNRRAEGRDIVEILSVEQDIAPLAAMLSALGAKTVLIKCGARGIYYHTAEEDVMRPLCEARGLRLESWSDISGFAHSFVPERVVSGTGAGDTCIAAFLSAMLLGRGFRACVDLAAAAGASCVASYDSLSALLPLDKLEEKIQNGWKRNNPS